MWIIITDISYLSCFFQNIISLLVIQLLSYIFSSFVVSLPPGNTYLFTKLTWEMEVEQTWQKHFGIGVMCNDTETTKKNKNI